MRTFFAPWPGDIGRYPASALERHSAHCRALLLPDSTHPSVVKPLLTADVRDAGQRAVENLQQMESWFPPQYNHNITTTVRQDILVPGYRHYAFFGSRGGSKSHGAAEAVIELASIGYERVVCGREYMSSIRDSSRTLMLNKIKRSRWVADWNITDREMTNKITNSVITFLGINRNPDSARSLEGCTIFIGEEAEAFSQESLDILLPTIRTEGSRMIWLWNPSDQNSPMSTMFMTEGEPPERSYIRCILSEDNPWFYRSTMPGERRSSWVKHTRAKFRHIWRGALDTNPDILVYNNWTIGRIPLMGFDIAPRFGLDWGWTHPLAIVESYVFEADDPETERGKIYIRSEIYGSGIPSRTIPRLLDETMPLARSHTIYCDSAEPKSIADLVTAGFDAVPVRKGPGSIRAGISLINSYDVVVSPDCPNTASELASHQYKVLRSGIKTTDPVDEDNHALDGLRYSLSEYENTGQGTGDNVIWL